MPAGLSPYVASRASAAVADLGLHPGAARGGRPATDGLAGRGPDVDGRGDLLGRGDGGDDGARHGASVGGRPRGRPRDDLRVRPWSFPALSPMCAGAGSGEREAHDHSRVTHPEVRRLHGRRRRHLHRPARPGHRLPRPQRRRQVHHHADHGRPHPGHLRLRPHRRRPLRRPDQPRPRGRRPPRRLGAARRTHRPRDPHHRAAHDGAAQGPRRRDARPGQPHAGGGGPPGPQLLPRHAAAARHRGRPHRRPARADPRRAGQRPRPGRHPLDARPAARLRHPWRHRAAVVAPAPRDRGHRRRHRRHRSRAGSSPRAPRPSCSPAPAPSSAPRRPTCSAGRSPPRASPCSAVDGGLRTDATPDLVGRVALGAGVPLTELRAGDGAGLEDMFLELTSDTQREGAAA